MVSLSGEALDSELVHFCTKARSIRDTYFDKYVSYEKQRSLCRCTVPFKEAPVFVTKKEREDYTCVANKTISEIKELIQHALGQIESEDDKELFNEVLHTDLMKRKGVTKVDYLTFYGELQEYIAMQNPDAQDSVPSCDTDDENY